MFKILLKYFFNGIVIKSIFIILVQNLFFAIIFLILINLGSIVVLIALELEFLPYIFSIIGIGALAVLLIFVLLVLDIIYQYFLEKLRYYPLGMYLSIVFFLGNIYFVSKYLNILREFPISILFSKCSNWSCTMQESIDTSAVLDAILNYEFIVQFLIAGFLLLFYIIFSIMRVLNEILNRMQDRLPYIFLTIYFGSLGILFIYVFLLYIMNYINRDTLHIVYTVCQECLSWCNTHTYILRYLMEFELTARFLIISIVAYIVWVGVSILVDVKVRIFIKIKKSSHQLARIFHIAFYGVKK